MTVKFSDETEGNYEPGTTLNEMLKQKKAALSGKVLAAKVDGQLVDLNYSLDRNANVTFLTFEDEQAKSVFWHSCAHVMAQAVKEIFPAAKLGIGPAIASGFYYDFEVAEPFSPENLKTIEKRMQDIIKSDLSIIREEMPKENAVKIFKDLGEPYKLELLSDIEDDRVTIYAQDGFRDLCRGPHLPSTGKLGAVKLLGVAGAYWRGDERNSVMQRIYGIAYPQKAQLRKHVEKLEEAKKRDHRKLGRQLDLFSFHEQAPGFPFWHHKGLVIFDECVKYWKKVHKRDGYQLVQTPLILSDDLWRCSGHWDNYKEAMYFTEIDNIGYAIKPMNCPGGLLIYKNSPRSYKDLPLKMGELGLVHRHEKRGVLHGLFRVRQFTQDDAHIFCLPEQAEQQVVGIINLSLEIYATFGFRDVYVELSTRPKKSIGSDDMWTRAEKTLRDALDKREITFEVNPGAGAFYGPKIDFHIEDSLSRRWQCGTIQLDFSMPERFGLEYVGKDGEKHRPVMIHRAIFGSLERFIGIITENYGGSYPLWLAPVQAKVIPISRDQMKYAAQIVDLLVEEGFRAELDRRDEKIGYKIRDAETLKIPYMIIIGEREVEGKTISLRQRHRGHVGTMSPDDLVSRLNEEIAHKI
ncbi:threonine--tRNA ligase [bacterium]|nr:threonine--tRNA ligase [bacterium]